MILMWRDTTVTKKRGSNPAFVSLPSESSTSLRHSEEYLTLEMQRVNKTKVHFELHTQKCVMWGIPPPHFSLTNLTVALDLRWIQTTVHLWEVEKA